MKPKIKKTCTFCGTIYESSRPDTRFCSTICCTKARRAAAAGMSYEAYKQHLAEIKNKPRCVPHKGPHALKCQYCGSEFLSKRPDTKWCSQLCLSRANQARQRGISYEEYGKNHAKDELIAINQYKKKQMQKANKKLSHLDQMIQEADALGMTYGQYKAYLMTKGVNK